MYAHVLVPTNGRISFFSLFTYSNLFFQISLVCFQCRLLQHCGGVDPRAHVYFVYFPIYRQNSLMDGQRVIRCLLNIVIKFSAGQDCCCSRRWPIASFSRLFLTLGKELDSLQTCEAAQKELSGLEKTATSNCRAKGQAL